MELTKKSLGPMRLVGIKHSGPYPEIGEKWHQLFGMVGQGMIPMGPETRMIGAYWDDPRSVPEAELRSMATVSVPADWNPPEGSGLELLDLPGKDYLATIHAGPYEGLAESWMAFTEALVAAAPNCAPDAGPALEIYLNNPMNTAPDDLRTELLAPVG